MRRLLLIHPGEPCAWKAASVGLPVSPGSPSPAVGSPYREKKYYKRFFLIKAASLTGSSQARQTPLPSLRQHLPTSHSPLEIKEHLAHL